MMSRQQMQAILGSLDTGKMVEALSAVGIECGYGEPELGAEGAAEGLESWNDTEVRVPSSQRGPLFDRTKLVEQQATAAPQTMQMQQVLGQAAPAAGLEAYAAEG